MRQRPVPSVDPSIMRRTRIRTIAGGARAALAAAVVQLLAMGAAVAAEGASEDAPPRAPADLFRRGLAEYDAQRYAAAIELFSRAYEGSHAPALLFNIAQSWRLLGDCSKATAMYEGFIAEEPGSPETERARGWVEKLGTCRTEKAQTAAATRAVAEPPPAPAALSTTPLRLAATPADKASGHPVLVGALSGVAFALASAGGYAAWRANDLSGQTTTSFSHGGTWTTDAAAVDREGRRDQIAAIGLLTTAVLSGIAAYVVHHVSAVPAPSAHD
jgi:tetratricopeptide (TPR) repeat protein